MAGKIFINYRRGDDAGYTQALYLRLEDEFGADNLFMDVEGHIKPGDDFVRVLDAQVAASDIVLAVIGPRWIDLMAKREGDPDDFVAIEIKSALDREKRVIPVLVGGALMPKTDALPETIRNMARRNAVGLRPERFKADVQGLVTALKEQLAAAAAERNARTQAEQAAAEAARRKSEEEAAARAEAAEARGRAQAVAGLSPEQIMKAEELANWDFIKESSDPQDFRDHLARFPKGVVERNARAKLEALIWQSLASAAPDDMNRGGRLASFIDEFPDGKFAAEAKAMRAAMAERAKQAADQLARMNAERDAWAEASRVNTVEAFKNFLAKWPNGENAGAAKARLKELRGVTGFKRLVLIPPPIVNFILGGICGAIAFGPLGSSTIPVQNASMQIFPPIFAGIMAGVSLIMWAEVTKGRAATGALIALLGWGMTDLAFYSTFYEKESFLPSVPILMSWGALNALGILLGIGTVFPPARRRLLGAVGIVLSALSSLVFFRATATSEMLISNQALAGVVAFGPLMAVVGFLCAANDRAEFNG